MRYIREFVAGIIQLILNLLGIKTSLGQRMELERSLSGMGESLRQGKASSEAEYDYENMSKSDRHDCLEQICSSSGDAVQLRYLLDAGVNLEKKIGGTKGTAFFLAVESGNKEVAQILSKEGAETEALDEENKTPLMAACANACKEAIPLVIAESEDLDRQDDDGRTALMHAAYGGDIAIVKMILNAGADKTIKDSDDYTAKGIAEENIDEDGDYRKIVALLA